MKIFVSNYLERLSQLLKNEVFQQEGHPFDKRWIIVPNERVKQDLFLQWAHDPLLQVATGCKIISWSQALSRLFPNVPSPAELSLKIEVALKFVQNAEPLLAYLNHGGLPRKASLCNRMSCLFLHYLDQPEEKLVQWLEKTGWQQSLWQAVFDSEIPWKTQNPFKGSVYLFNPFQIAPYQLAAFKKMQTTCFLFSPSEMYWGDFHTLQEQGYLLKRAPAKTRKELLQFFENEHLLLAHWGRKGRQLLSLFEDELWIDAYEEPENHSLLTRLHEEMLTLTMAEKTPDTSIQIHSAPSKLREVEVVWEIIQRLPFKPSEILVLAPDMQDYAPIVELIFRQRSGPFDFAIFGLEARCKSALMQGFEALLELSHYRFSKEAVEKLLFCPAFLKKFDFKIEDAHLLLKWISQVHIRYDLKGDHPGTWQEGLKRLVEALVTTVRENHLTLDFSEAEILSRWITVIGLFEGISNEERSLKAWSKTLKTLVDQFFAPDPDDHLRSELEKFQQMDIEGTFPFSSIERILKNIFQQKSGSVQSSHLQAVRFASLEKGALTPAKVMILMGMEEGSFPRQDPPSSLQELAIPSRIEEDRYLFLEAFCNAREIFIMTYLRVHPEDGKSQKPSLLIEELSHYCSNLPTTHHPFSPFNPSYYQEGSFRSFSKAHFDALQKTHVAEPQVPQLPSSPIATLDIRMLRNLARHPLKFFLEERLGIDFEWKEQNTEFTVSPLDMILLRKASLKQPLEELLQEMAKEGSLPIGSFSTAAIQKIRDEIKTYHAMLSKLHVNPEEIYSIELKSSCKEPTQIDSNRWVYPALHVNNVMVQGRIDEMSPQGLLFHGDDTLADQLKAWPLLLIVSKLGLPNSLLMIKKGKMSEIKPSPDSLEKYVRYAEKALTMPSPLHPKWARGLFKEGKIPVTEEDEIINWAQSRDLLPPIDLWLKAWNPHLQEVFNELL
jgi:exonuclease V gamma subunit